MSGNVETRGKGDVWYEAGSQAETKNHAESKSKGGFWYEAGSNVETKSHAESKDKSGLWYEVSVAVLSVILVIAVPAITIFSMISILNGDAVFFAGLVVLGIVLPGVVITLGWKLMGRRSEDEE